MIKAPAGVSEALIAKVKEIRRRIHQYPELSNQEHATQKMVERELRRRAVACRLIDPIAATRRQN